MKRDFGYIWQFGRKFRSRRFNREKGTKRMYADSLEAFNRWLSGKRFPAGNGAQRSGEERRTFQNVKDLLGVCYDSEHGIRTAKRVVREYLADLATSKHSLSTAMVRCAAVKSYLATHDVQVDVGVNRKRHTVHDVREPPEMSLFDFYKMMTVGNMGVMLKAMMMIKFQAGLDASTLADRFNFEAYGQIVKHFGIDDYEAWDLGRCPVPIRLVRVKTGMAYTTFIDRDAVAHLQDYLRWREFQGGQKARPGQAAVRDAPRRARGPQLDIQQVLQGRNRRRDAKEGLAPRVQDPLARGARPAQEHPDSVGVRAVRGRARAGARPEGLVREAGLAVPGDPAERVRQGVGAPEHIHEHREAPEGSRRGFRGAAGREGGRRRGPPLPKDRGAATTDAGDAAEDDRRHHRHPQDHGDEQGRKPGRRVRGHPAQVHGTVGRGRGRRAGPPPMSSRAPVPNPAASGTCPDWPAWVRNRRHVAGASRQTRR